MKNAKKLLTRLILSLILSVIIYAGPALGFTNEEIFHWVADRLEIKADFPMPEVIFASKEELQRVFRKGNEKSLKRWAGIYGKEKASEIMDQYLKEVIGLFNPKISNVVYVGSFLEPCRQEAIVAHEFTHYFQTIQNESGNHSAYVDDTMRFYHELQASKIETEFRETLCPLSVAKQEVDL